MYRVLNWSLVTGITGAAFLLTLVLPGRWYLLPALLLCPLAPILAMRQLQQPWRHPDWTCYPDKADLSRLQGICVDPELLIGQRGMTAEVWMPFEPVAAERFRSKSGAVALAAAAALISGHLPPDPDTPDEWLEPQRWLSALGIQPDNFKRVNPFLDEATYHGYRGVVVSDGPGERAYFCGNPAIVQRCVHVLDGVSRRLLPDDRERLAAALPSDALCYATAPVEDGKLGELCFLGAIRPASRCTPSVEALDAGEAVQRAGYHIMLTTARQGSLQAVRAMGITWPEDDGSPDLVELRPRHEPDAQTRRFDLALDSLLAHGEHERRRRIMAAWFGLLLWPCATLCASRWPLVVGILCCCAGILLSRGLPIAFSRSVTWQTLVIASLPAVLIPILMALFLPQLQNESAAMAGGMTLLAEAAFWALSFPWPHRNRLLPDAEPVQDLGLPVDFLLTPLRRRLQTGLRAVLLTALCCLVGFALLYHFTAAAPGSSAMTALFGLVAGSLIAACVLMLYGQLTRS